MSAGEITGSRLRNMVLHALNIVRTLRVKNPKYGDSWKSHGGFSAFFNMQRKWSRVEHLASQHGFDVFMALDATRGHPDGMAEALKDLGGYGLLVLDECEQMDPPATATGNLETDVAAALEKEVTS